MLLTEKKKRAMVATLRGRANLDNFMLQSAVMNIATVVKVSEEESDDYFGRNRKALLARAQKARYSDSLAEWAWWFLHYGKGRHV